MDILVSAAESGGIARCGQEFQIFGRRRREVDESAKPISQMGAVLCGWNIRTLGSSCRSKDRVLQGTTT